MKLRYVGEAPSVTILVDGGGVLAVFGEPFDVDETLGKELLHQDIFERVTAPKATKKQAAKAATQEEK